MLDFVLILFRAVGRTFQAVDTHMSVSCFGIVVEFFNGNIDDNYSDRFEFDD